MSKLRSAALLTLSFLLTLSVIFFMITAIDEANDKQFEKRNQQHWEDVARCEERGGTIFYGESGWFKWCAVAP